jgi:disulfide bond formation protein DsbB
MTSSGISTRHLQQPNMAERLWAMLPSRRVGYALAFAVCAALMGTAFYLQYVEGMEPCPLCMFQRIALTAMGILFLVAAIQRPSDRGARTYAVLLAVVGAVGVGLAWRHLWIQSLPPDQVPACGMGIGYMFETLPFLEVIERTLKGSGECAQVDRVLGLSIPMWTLMLFVALVGWGVLMAVRRDALRAATRADAQPG